MDLNLTIHVIFNLNSKNELKMNDKKREENVGWCCFPYFV